MKYEILFEIYGRKFRITVPAENENQAKHKLFGKIYTATKFLSIEEKKPVFGKDSVFERLKHIMNIK